MRRLLLLPIILSLCACASTKPGGGADLRYRIPRTDATATLTLTMKDCDRFRVDADLKVEPKAGAQDHQIVVPGSALASVRIKRTLKVGLNDSGAIKSLNSTVADRTPQIIGGYLAAAAKIVPYFAATTTDQALKCGPDLEAAVARAAQIRTQLMALRGSMTTDPAKRPAQLTADDRERIKDIEALGKELGALDPVVRLDVKATIELVAGAIPSESSAQGLAFDDKTAFRPWFGADASAQQISRQFGLVWWGVVTPSSGPSVFDGKNRHLRNCGLSIPVPSPVTVKVHVKKSGQALPTLEEAREMAAAQLAADAQLCIDAGFGENRTIELAFDDYGRTTVYNWQSDAQGEVAASMVSDSAGDLATIGKSVRGKSDLEQQKAEIDELETEAKLAKLRACKVIRDAGGDCDAK